MSVALADVRFTLICTSGATFAFADFTLAADSTPALRAAGEVAVVAKAGSTDVVASVSASAAANAFPAAPSSLALARTTTALRALERRTYACSSYFRRQSSVPRVFARAASQVADKVATRPDGSSSPRNDHRRRSRAFSSAMRSCARARTSTTFAGVTRAVRALIEANMIV